MTMKRIFFPVFVTVLLVLSVIPLCAEPVHAESEVQDLGNITINFNEVDRIVYTGDTLETGKMLMDVFYAAAMHDLVRREKNDDIYQLDLDRNDSWDVKYIYNSAVEFGEPSITFIRLDTCSIKKTSTVTLTYDALQTAGEYAGKAYSSATFMFGTKLTILSQPQNADVTDGDRASFTVEAEGDELTYRWMESTDNGNYWHVCTENGCTASKLEFTATMDHRGNLYRCEITDAHGVTLTTDSALLTVLVKPFDAGAYTMDLSNGPSRISAYDDMAQYMKIMGMVYAYGKENPSYMHTEGIGPDLILLDLDQNGSWDLKMEVYEENEMPCIRIGRTDECSVIGSITITPADMVTVCQELYMDSYYSNVTFVMSSVAVSLTPASYIYDGNSKTPEVTVTSAVNGVNKTLSNGPDYKVSYPDERTNAGTYHVTVELNSGQTITESFTIDKAANPLKVKGKTASVKYADVKKKAKILAVSKVLKFSNKGEGALSYKKASGSKKITINKTTGKVTIKKGLKKGTYKVKVTVKAAGSSNYEESAGKSATITIKIK